VKKKKNDIVWEDSNLMEPRELKEKVNEASKEQNYNRHQSFYTSQKKSKRKLTTLKPIIFASFSAVAIGGILGVLLLSMFTHFPSDPEQHSQTLGTSHAPQKDNNEDQKIGTKTFTLPQMHGHVLQVGMFAEESNAEEWFSIYDDADIPTYIWEESDEFYLFAGLLKTEDNAKQAAEKVTEKGFDVFTKVWETNEQDIELAEQEYEWLQSMVSQWETSLESLQDEDELQSDAWGDLLEQAPTEMPHISELVEQIEQIYEKEMAQAEGKEKQLILLSIWDHYARLPTD